jgi:hypothetical protein
MVEEAVDGRFDGEFTGVSDPALSRFSVQPESSRTNHRAHNRKGWGVFEKEQPKVGPKGEMSGSERVKGHRG